MDVQALHDLFYGPQDRHIDEHIKNASELDQSHIKIDTTRQIIIRQVMLTTTLQPWHKDGYYKSCILIDPWIHGNDRYGITKIRIINKQIIDENDIFWIEIGSQNFNTVDFYDGVNSDELEFDITSNGNIFPGLIHHTFYLYHKRLIYEEHKQKSFQFEYTLVPLINGPIKLTSGIMVRNISDYNNSPICVDGIHKGRFSINHPVFQIDFYTEHEVSEESGGNLMIDNYITLPLTKISNKNWRIKFADVNDYKHTVNFSKIYSSQIVFGEDAGHIKYRAKVCDIYRICNEMAGLAFSK